MDSFLYIIIGIVWVVYSLYTNKQKQQKKREMEANRKIQTPVEPVPQQKPRSLLEQLLNPEQEWPASPTVAYDDYEDAVESDYIETAPETIEDIPFFEQYKSVEPIKDEISDDYFENQYASRGGMNYYDKREELVASHDEVPLIEELVEDFDLRKAVIFSEILNPKYI